MGKDAKTLGLLEMLLCLLLPTACLSWLFLLLPDTAWSALFPSAGSLLAMFLLLAGIPSILIDFMEGRKKAVTHSVLCLLCIVWYILARIPNSFFQMNWFPEFINTLLLGAW